MKGKVYLVGAGPGDPKLITVRGLEALKRADVVVYDRLASPRLLQHVKLDAEKIYVGKLPDRHTMKQEDINQLLVDKALEGKIVARLKGGDPNVFGRVGEEAELLVDNGIEFEIVPGITSAIAVPAYAGIPVTHRDYSSSLSIVTGHEDPTKLETNIDWENVAKATDTIIFLMGVAKLDLISSQLIHFGKDPKTPVALIRWGTRIEQETIVGTLADIAEKVRKADFQPPAVTLIGKVVEIREKLAWFERKPLFGKRVLVTRARSQASELSDAIDDLGGEAVELPVIRIQAPTDSRTIAETDAVLHSLQEMDWVIFTSVNGVNYFFKRLRELGLDIRSMAKAKIAAVGPKTAEALLEKGLTVEKLPSAFHGEGLLDAILPKLRAGQKALLPRGDLARAYLPEKLKEIGLDVTEIDVYETVSVPEYAAEIVKLLSKRSIHMITFTSSSTVTNLLRALKEQGVADVQELLAGVDIACIGPLTAETAQREGLQVTHLAKESTIESLIEAMISVPSS